MQLLVNQPYAERQRLSVYLLSIPLRIVLLLLTLLIYFIFQRVSRMSNIKQFFGSLYSNVAPCYAISLLYVIILFYFYFSMTSMPLRTDKLFRLLASINRQIILDLLTVSKENIPICRNKYAFYDSTTTEVCMPYI